MKILRSFGNYYIEGAGFECPDFWLGYNANLEISAEDNLRKLVSNYKNEGKAVAVFGTERSDVMVCIKLDGMMYINDKNSNMSASEFAGLVEEGLRNGFEEMPRVPVPEGDRFEIDENNNECVIGDFVTDEK